MPKDTLAKLAADFGFLIAIGFVIACNLYFEPRIKNDRVAMQWGLMPDKVHSPELGIAVFSIIFALSHLFVISKATKQLKSS